MKYGCLSLKYESRAPKRLVAKRALRSRSRAPKRLVAQRRRYVRVYKDIAAASVTFWEGGGARQRANVFLGKEKRSKANFAPTKKRGKKMAESRRKSSVGTDVRGRAVKTIKKTGKVKINFKRLIVCILAFLFIIYFSCTIISQQRTIRRKNNEIETLSEQISDANRETDRLKEELESVNDPEYLERMAREKLGLVSPNERVYIDENSGN